MLLIPLSFGGAFVLTWKECVRLGLILGGLLYLYRRYRDALMSSEAGKEPGGTKAGSDRVLRYASAVMALLLMFLVTQFDPATSAINTFVQRKSVSWFFVASTVLIAVAFGVWALGAYLSRSSRAWGLSAPDKLVLGVGAFVIVISVASRALLTPTPFPTAGLTGNVKVLGYVMLWFVATRVYGPGHEGSSDVWVRRGWRISALVIFVLFAATLLIGACRTGAALHFYRQGRRVSRDEVYEEAIRWYERTRRINRTLDLDWVREGCLEDMATIYLTQGEMGSAEQILNEIRERASWDAKVLRRIGDVYYRMGIWDGAIPEYRQYLETVSTRRGASNLRKARQVLSDIAPPDEAVLTGEPHSGRETQDKTALNRLATSYVKVLDRRELLSLIETYRYIPDMEVSGYTESVFAGDIFLNLHEFDRALDAFSQAASVHPEDAYAVYKMGRTWRAREDIERAIEAFQRALELDPKFADAYYRLGLCLEELGQEEEARQAYEGAVEALPNHLDALLALQHTRSAEALLPEHTLSARLRAPDGMVLELVGYGVLLLAPVSGSADSAEDGYAVLPCMDAMSDSVLVVKPGQELRMLYYWRLSDRVFRNYGVAMGVEGSRVVQYGPRHLIGQGSSVDETDGVFPSAWSLGGVVVDRHDVTIEPFMRGDTWEVLAGLTLADGEEIPGIRSAIEKISVGRVRVDEKAGALVLGKAYLAAELYQEALREFVLFAQKASEGDKEALEQIHRAVTEGSLSNETAFALYLRGRYRQLAEEYRRAADLFARCVERDPKMADARYRLGQCYERMGRSSDALAAYRATLAHDRGHAAAVIAMDHVLAAGVVAPERARQIRRKARERFRMVIGWNDWRGRYFGVTRRGWIEAEVRLPKGDVEFTIYAQEVGSDRPEGGAQVMLRLDESPVGMLNIEGTKSRPYRTGHDVRTGGLHRLVLSRDKAADGRIRVQRCEITCRPER